MNLLIDCVGNVIKISPQDYRLLMISTERLMLKPKELSKPHCQSSTQPLRSMARISCDFRTIRSRLKCPATSSRRKRFLIGTARFPPRLRGDPKFLLLSTHAHGKSSSPMARYFDRLVTPACSWAVMASSLGGLLGRYLISSISLRPFIFIVGSQKRHRPDLQAIVSLADTRV